MSHRSVVQLLKDTAEMLEDRMQFGYGRTSDFNVKRDKQYPFIWLDPLNASPTYSVNSTENYIKSWSVRMLFYQLDSEDSVPKEYQTILDEMDIYVDKYINLLNQVYLKANERARVIPDPIVITGITQDQFVKATADILTGWIVTFTLTVPDQFDYCSIENV